MATRPIAGFLTKLPTNWLALCDFQLWKDDFSNCESFSAHMHTNIRYIISLLSSCPRPQIRIFNQTQWDCPVLRTPGRSHLTSTALAAFLLTCEICPRPHPKGSSIDLKITALRTQWLSCMLFCQGQSHQQQKPAYLPQRESIGGQNHKKSMDLPGNGGFS